MNEYQTYKEWQSKQSSGLFESIEHIMELPFFENYTALELDTMFMDMYGERFMSLAYNDKTTNEVAIQLVLRFSSKWNELYEWFNINHPFNASSVETFTETVTDSGSNMLDGELTHLDSAFNTDDFVNKDKETTLKNTQSENERVREQTRTRESLQAMTIRRNMLTKEVFIDNVFKDTILMICLSIY